MSVNLGPFNPTTQSGIDAALDVLNLDENDVVTEIGCGLAGFCVSAANRTNCRLIIGIENDPIIYARAVENVKTSCSPEAASRIDLRLGDAATDDWGKVGQRDADVTCMFVYLIPRGLPAIQDRIRRVLENGGRIASYTFSLPEEALPSSCRAEIVKIVDPKRPHLLPMKMTLYYMD